MKNPDKTAIDLPAAIFCEPKKNKKKFDVYHSLV